MSQNVVYHINKIISDTGEVRFEMTGGIAIPVGDTANRPSNSIPGTIRFNTDIEMYEGYDGAGWIRLGSFVSDSDGDTTITAENTTGSNEDTLIFKTAGSIHALIGSDGSIYLGANLNDATQPTNSSFYIDPVTGNVGIKSTSPDTELYVDGTITATEFVGLIDGGTY